MKTYKDSYTKPIPEDAVLIKVKGEQFAKIKDRKGDIIKVPIITTDKGKRLKYESSCWSITFIDNFSIRRKIKAFTDESSSNYLASWIDRLLKNNGVLDNQLYEWFMGLIPSIKEQIIKFNLINKNKFLQEIERIVSMPDDVRERLTELNLIDKNFIDKHITKRRNLDKPLDEHLSDFRDAMLTKENGKGYSEITTERLKYIFSECGFEKYSDIVANEVYTFIGDLKKDSLDENGKSRRGIGQRTFNCYLKAAKYFCRWMIKERRASINPLEHLSCVKQTEKRKKRRALTIAEQQKLIDETSQSGFHHNMSGIERAMLYRLAIETGLRAGELRSLTKSSFDFENNILTVQAGYTKNKQVAEIDLKQRTSTELKIFLEHKMPNMKVFAMPDQPVKMIKKDLEKAEIPYMTDEGQCDFHSLRHCFITNLARAGVHPSDAMVLARHSTITLTMDYYTHSKRESRKKIIENQPDFKIGKNETNKRIA